ncbi:alpha/beta fold hydrolase [Pseudonocardia acidicola]|uniref:Alpha/beta hydrolase n=1 Tax=Pseudonocardia acidicola TaxID=2724939 RepID=A0ABX1S864_9PSEU|nr:alpha/beta hydrolase [Pseudonocardia acidicola]NMH96777.1 alpha/beta hydrolase [Pseudonocardia acidicola]
MNETAPNAIVHRTVEVNGVRLHLAEAGPADGPTVLLLHGFPECWYSWRHQLAALAADGYHVVAPDQRGYARSEAPVAVDAYTILHLAGDAVGVLDAVSAEQAVVVGHDWGAPVAWHTALLRPDRVRGVVGLSVPFVGRSRQPPLPALARRFGGTYYQLYFQIPGVADAELGADPRATLRRLLSRASGGQVPPDASVPAGGGFLDLCPEPGSLPGWLTEADLDVYEREYRGAGFTGGLNWYRNIARNWELTAPWQGAAVTPPALYLAGEDDLVVAGTEPDAIVGALTSAVTDLRGATFLPGCGHWTQQERPAEINTALLNFMASLK